MGRSYNPVFFEAQKIEGLIRSASGGNQIAAEDLLLAVVHYIRANKPLPHVLGQYLADAIETAVNNPERLDPQSKSKGAGAALLIGLNLKALHAPAKGGDPYAVCAFLYRELYGRGYDDPPRGAFATAVKGAADHFGISVSTVKRYWKNHCYSYWRDCLTAEADPPDLAEMEQLAEKEQLSKGG